MFVWDWFTGVLGYLGKIYLRMRMPVDVLVAA